jgi:transcription elongation factor Elf1
MKGHKQVAPRGRNRRISRHPRHPLHEKVCYYCGSEEPLRHHALDHKPSRIVVVCGECHANLRKQGKLDFSKMEPLEMPDTPADERQAVLPSGVRCRFCGSEQDLQAHYPLGKPEDIIVLCLPCHGRLHSPEYMAGERVVR